LAKGDSKIGDGDSNNCAEKDRNERDKEGAETASGANCKTSKKSATGESGENVAEINSGAFGAGDDAGGGDGLFDIGEDGF
jgi:hypothetical protein